jgi:hypothetical protein
MARFGQSVEARALIPSHANNLRGTNSLIVTQLCTTTRDTLKVQFAYGLQRHHSEIIGCGVVVVDGSMSLHNDLFFVYIRERFALDDCLKLIFLNRSHAIRSV